jgi:PIN domain nuclease of toxin-antitoxin system
MRCVILIDTHVLVWAMTTSPRLGPKARALFESEFEETKLGISAITPWEIALLVTKNRLTFEVDVADWIAAALTHPRAALVPIEPVIAVESTRLPDYRTNDPADRIIVATARHFQIPLVTADRMILAYAKAGYLETVDAEK